MTVSPPLIESGHGYRILIIAPSWIGDTILAQPLFRRLAQQHPGLVLDVLAPPWVAPLLARMPEVSNVIDSPFRHGGLDWAKRKALGRALAAKYYHQAYVLPNSWKSALVPFFASIPLRTGYQGETRYVLLNDRLRVDPVAHPQLAQRYAALAGKKMDEQPLQAHLTSSVEQQQAACLQLGLPVDVKPIIFCPGAEFGPAKRWPGRHYAALARQLATPEHPVWLLGSAGDAAVGAEIEAESGGSARNLCGQTTLEQAIDLLASAHLVVSNDSGLMHVAAALNRPLLAVYGSSSPSYTPPMSSSARIVSLNVECSPCFARVCPLGHFKCMEQLSPELVMQRLEK